MTYLEYLLLVRKLFLHYSALPDQIKWGLCYANLSACGQADNDRSYMQFRHYIKHQCKGNVWVTSNLPLHEIQTASEYKERCKACRFFLIEYAIGMEKQHNKQIKCNV